MPSCIWCGTDFEGEPPAPVKSLTKMGPSDFCSKGCYQAFRRWTKI